MIGTPMISFLDQYRISKRGKVEAFALSFFITLLGLAVPIVTLQVYDRLLKNRSVETAVVLIVGAAIAIMLESFLRYGRSYMLSHYSVGFETTAEKHFMRKFLRLKKEDREKYDPALINRNQTDFMLLKNHYSGQTVLALFDLPSSVFYLFIIWYVGGVIALVPLTLMIIVGLLALKFRESAAEAIAQKDADSIGLIRKLYGYFANAKKMKYDVSGAIDDISSSATDARKSRVEVSSINLFSTDLVSSLSQLTTVLIVLFGAILVIQGRMTTGGLAALTILGGRSIGPVTRLIAFNIGLESLSVALERIEKINALTPRDSFSSEVSSHQDLTGAVDLDSFGIAIDDKEYLLHHSIKEGEKVSLRATKSDGLKEKFLSLLIGEEKLVSSDVEIGGVPVKSFDQDSYFRTVGYVTSHEILYPGSLMQNLSNFQKEYEPHVEALCEKLGILQEIERLPHGFKTAIASTEAPPLDQGFIQVVGIVRTLVMKPKVLL